MHASGGAATRSVPGRAIAFAFTLAVLAAPARAERLPIRVFTTADGLASDEVQVIRADSRGFLWFGTGYGLSRYDGYRFVNYGTEHGLRDPWVNDILETRDGTLWIATAAGLGRFRPRAAITGAGPLIEVFHVGTRERSNQVHALLEDHKGQLWAGTADGLFAVDRSPDRVALREVPLDLPEVPPPGWLSVRAMVEDREGSLWLGTRLGLVRRLADGGIQWHPARSRPLTNDDRIMHLTFDHGGRLWMAHNNDGVFVVMPTPAPRELLPRGMPLADAAAAAGPARDRLGRWRLPERPGEIRHFTDTDGLGHYWARFGALATGDGRVWIGTFGGVTVVEPDGRFRTFAVNEGLSTAVAGPSTEDPAGNLWLRSEGGGAMRIVGGGWTSFDARDGLGTSFVRSIQETRGGEVFAVTDLEQPHIARRVGDGFESWPMNLGPGGTLGWGWQQIAAEGIDGDWWFAGTRLYRFARPARLDDLARSPPKAIYSQRDGVGSDVFRVFADRRGDVWIGSLGSQVLSRWRRATGRFEQFGQADGIHNDGPLAFAEDRAGNVWIAFASGGLVRHRLESGRFETFGPAEGIPAGSLEALVVDGSGRLWVGSTLDGLIRIDHPEQPRPATIHLTTRDGLASDQVATLAEDRDGRIFVATARGLDRLDPRTGRIRHFTSAHGLVGGRLRATFGGRDGAVWLGTSTGLSRLQPAAERSERPAPILITAVRVGGVARPITETGEETVDGLELRPGQREVAIEFVGLSFVAGETLRYQYRLEGGTGQWSQASEQRTVTLANLAPGSYRFAVRAVTAAGLASPRPATVAFELPPPFWRRGWFLLLVAAAALLLAMTFHRQRIARVLAVERVRTRIATDLHDDLGASLSRISILSEAARHQLGRGEEPAGRLEEIADTAREMVDAAADIVWSTDPRRDDLQSLLARLRRFAGELLEAQGIAWSLTEPPGAGAVRLPPELRQHLFLILKEALANAARHAGARRVDVAISLVEGSVVAEVRDDGRGFTVPGGDARDDDEPLAAGNGLGNMRARAHALGGEVRVESTPGIGTRVTAELPLARRAARWSRSA